jgi:hypothetical protein
MEPTNPEFTRRSSDAVQSNEKAWFDEAGRRYYEYKAGQMTARTADEVFEEAYRMFQ